MQRRLQVSAAVCFRPRWMSIYPHNKTNVKIYRVRAIVCDALRVVYQ